MPRKRIRAELRHHAPVFAALGDEVRLHLVARLCAGGPLSISRLSEGVEITRQGVTKHLHVLKEAGLVKGKRSGREQIWELNAHEIQAARRYLDVISTEWENALGRLKALIEEDKT